MKTSLICVLITVVFFLPLTVWKLFNILPNAARKLDFCTFWGTSMNGLMDNDQVLV